MNCILVILLGICGDMNAAEPIDDEAGSLFRAVMANNLSIQSYDVLITSETFYDSPVEGVVHRQVRKRQRWREVDGNHLVASHSRMDTWSATQDDASSSRETIFGATFKKEDRGVMIHNGRRQRITTVGRNFETTKSWVAWINHVPFGIESIFSCTRPSWKTEEAEHKLSGNKNFEVGNNSLNQIIVSSSYFNPGESRGSSTWCFSPVTSMPVSYRWSANRLKPGDEYSTGGGEQIEWIECNGVYVPSLLVNQNPGTVKTEGGTREHYISTQTYQFQWFSVNEELKDSDFDEAIIRTPELIHGLVKSVGESVSK